MNRGYTIIEAIVGAAIFLFITGALFGMAYLVFENIGQTRVRHTARLLANERMEEARNLSYDNLGTSGGIPSGPIAQEEIVGLGGLDFTVKTTIVYVDDPFDGEAPVDTLATDYKRIRVDVSWGGAFTSGKRPVILVSDIVPKGVETSAGGGTLSILVFNAEGGTIGGAEVRIVNSDVAPAVDLTNITDSFGRVLLPGAPVSVGGYKITVTKSDYSTDRTYGEEEVANPTKPHLSVLEGEVTEASFAIDRVSSLTIGSFGSRVSGFPSLGNVQLRLRGNKIIGTDTQENLVYKYDEELETDGSGQLSLENMEFDSYVIEITAAGYNLAGSNPALPFALEPDTEASIDLALENSSQHSLLVLVADSETDPLASASARLVNGALEYDETIETGAPEEPDLGHAYFGNLSPLQYQLTVSLLGYEETTAPVQVNEDTFTTILLNPL